MARALALAAWFVSATARMVGAAGGPCVNCCMDMQMQSTLPSFIDVVGVRDGVPDPRGTFTVTLRLSGWGLLGNVPVEIQFHSPDIKICTTQPTEGETVTCDRLGLETTVVAYTDPLGVATFNLVGASNGAAGSIGGMPATARIVVGGCVLSSDLKVAAFDLNGAGGMRGVDAGDLAVWLSDFGNQAMRGYRERSDYNHDGVLAANDLSGWLHVFGAGTSRSGGSGAYCP